MSEETVEARVAKARELANGATPLLTTNDEMRRTYLSKDELIESHAKYIVKLETELEQLRKERDEARADAKAGWLRAEEAAQVVGRLETELDETKSLLSEWEDKASI